MLIENFETGFYKLKIGKEMNETYMTAPITSGKERNFLRPNPNILKCDFGMHLELLVFHLTDGMAVACSLTLEEGQSAENPPAIVGYKEPIETLASKPSK